MGKFDQYRHITTYQSKHCEVEIFVDDNYDKKEYEARVTEYYELLYRNYLNENDDK